MKILAVANAHALAHVSRLLEIAKVLRDRDHQVLFAGHGKYLSVVEGDGFTCRELPYISVEQVVAAVRSQRLWELYPESQLETFIEAELDLLRDYRPDLVLIDNRPTARTTAEMAGIKTAAVLNVHMSNHKLIPFFSLANRLGDVGVPGVRLLDRLGNAIECQFYDRLVMRGLNRIRRRAGLERLFAYEHEEGDLTLFADVPEFSPVRELPASARYVGPLTWHNDLPAPRCLEHLSTERPTVYLSLGSEGLEDLLGRLDILAQEGVQIVVATGAVGGVEDLAVPAGVFIEQYVNTELLLPHCDLVCCHGGNGTLYQALSFGLPLVVVATHEEQLYGGKRIARLGLGRTLTLKQVNREGMGLVVEAIRQVLDDPAVRAASQSFEKHIQRWQPAVTAAAAIEAFVAKG